MKKCRKERETENVERRKSAWLVVCVRSRKEDPKEEVVSYVRYIPQPVLSREEEKEFL